MIRKILVSLAAVLCAGSAARALPTSMHAPPAQTPFIANGGASSSSPAIRAGHMLNAIDDFGAYGDGAVDSMLVSCASGSPAVTFARNGSNPYPPFSAADAGKLIDLPGCGATSSALAVVSIVSGGTGHQPGDIITMAGGTGAAFQLIVLTTTSYLGPASLVALASPGAYSVAPSGTISEASSSGSGTGLQVTMTFQNRLLAPIASVQSATAITLGANAGASQTAAAQTVAWGHDDSTALQNAVNSCKFITLPAGLTFMTASGVTLPDCAPFGFAASAGLISASSARMRAFPGALFVIASANWANNVAFAALPYNLSNLTFDAAQTATTAFDDFSYASIYSNAHFTNALANGVAETTLTANGTVSANGGENAIFENGSDAVANGANGLYQDARSSSPKTDVQIDGGYWHDNGAWQFFIPSMAGWQIRGVHVYDSGNRGAFLGNVGYGSVIEGNYFETLVDVASINLTSHVGAIGPANQFGAGVKVDFADAYTGSLLRVQGNNFYNCASSITHAFNGTGHPIFSSSNNFQCGPYAWTGFGAAAGQIFAEHDTLLFGGTNGQLGPCEINGFVQQTPAGGGGACTDFDVVKTAASGATSLTFTIAATVLNYGSVPGAGFDLQGQLDVSSYYAGPTSETYQANVRASYAHVSNTTNVVHSIGVNNVVDSSGTPAISTAASCVDTTVSASANNVETCTVTMTFPAALDLANTTARLHFHSDSRQVVGMTLQ